MDRRTQKTQNAICDAFLTLASKKNINKITVAEISQLANLSRGTFYLHYKDIDHLYEQIEYDFYSEIEQLFDQSYSGDVSDDLMFLTHKLIEFIELNRKTFLLLVGLENNNRTLHKLKLLMDKKMTWKKSNLYSSDYYAVKTKFIISGVMGVLEEWILNRLELSQQQISEELYSVLQRLEQYAILDIYYLLMPMKIQTHNKDERQKEKARYGKNANPSNFCYNRKG